MRCRIGAALIVLPLWACPMLASAAAEMPTDEQIRELERKVQRLEADQEAKRQAEEETRATQARQEEEKPPVPGIRTFRDKLQDGSEGPEMVLIPAGSFTMGSPREETGRLDNEGPPRAVTIAKPFAIGKYEVTFAEYDRFVRAMTGRDSPDDVGWGREHRPVVNVSWQDAVAYAEWLSAATGQRYRLPSEAEWEYAARGGTTAAYWWGDAASREYANYGADECCGGQADGPDQWINTAPAGSFPANPFGLHDMLGNVWEWTQDCWNKNYHGAPVDGSAWESGDCSRRVRRGGSWGGLPNSIRSAHRAWNNPDDRQNFFLGFRVVREY